MLELEQVKRQVSMAKEEGYEVIQLDECLFQVDHMRQTAWSPKGQPLRTLGRFANKQVVVVCGAISSERGLVHMKYGYRSFNAMDMVQMFKKVRQKSGKHKKLALFMDNASIHRALISKDECKHKKSNIVTIFNRPYRPDLNGIEFYWRDIKRRYRQRMNWQRVNGLNFEHLEVVRQMIDETPNELAKRCALQGEKNIRRAKPVGLLHHEVPPDYDMVEHMKA